jgi:hypothetical protein
MPPTPIALMPIPPTPIAPTGIAPTPIPPTIVDCGSSWRVNHASGPATFYVKRVYPTRADVQAILDAAATGPAVIIWPSAGHDVSSSLQRRTKQCAVPAS